jgi:hypothetical protein
LAGVAGGLLGRGHHRAVWCRRDSELERATIRRIDALMVLTGRAQHRFLLRVRVNHDQPSQASAAPGTGAARL